MVGNNILDDISAIRTNLNELRKEELATTFPTNPIAGQPCARLEKRDDDGVTDKVVVYRRDASNTGWIRVWDEEYGINADLYKGNDVDSNGDGVVDYAEKATNALNAYSANKVEGLTLGQERFTISSNRGSSEAINAGGTAYIQKLIVKIPGRKSLKLKRARFDLINDDLLLRVINGEAVQITEQDVLWTSASYIGEEEPNTTIYTNNGT